MLAGGLVVLLAFREGGYDEASVWWAATVALLAAAGLAFLYRPVVPTRLELVAVLALAALAGWAALSALWSPDPDASLLEAQRTFLYVAALAAALVVRGALLAGTLAGIGIVCAYALGERLLNGPPSPPDPFEGTLLHEPLGYANALGGLAAIGLAAGVAFLLDARLRPVGLAAVALFLPTLALTGSRGGWVAALAGCAVALALRTGRRRLGAVAAGVAALALVVALVLPAGSLADDLADRAGDRPWYWHVAWAEVAEHPLAGRGAGTFELAWLEAQPAPVFVRDAHSLYLETLAELGVVGLTLLALALAAPLAAASLQVSAAAAGGYVAFLVHAGVDWDWEMPVVTAAGLFCGAALFTQHLRNAGQGQLRSDGQMGRGDL